MSESNTGPEDEQRSKRERVGMFLEKELAKGKDEALRGRIKLEHSLGLGPKPNIIPPGEARIHGEPRTVEIGWHPVAGFGGKWFAEKTRLGKMITERVGKYPDPTQHWAVLVDEYVHELWMDEHLDVIYINEKLDRAEWHTFEVGKTRFNDEALRQAGEMVIHNMRQKRAAYNLISNNCQNFAVAMLDAVQTGAHQQFATAFAVYQRVTGRGEIKDLFAEPPPEEKQPDEQVDPDRLALHRQNTVEYAQQVMEENTTHLDDHHEPFY